MRPDQVAGVSLLWWNRWLVQQKAQGARQATEHFNSYRDADGNKNESEWAEKFPGLAANRVWSIKSDG